MTSADYLVVGGGIAGSVLAWTLDQAGCRVVLANASGLPMASGVAAGIVNPLTGRKLVRTWRADDLFPFLHQFYQNLETKLGASFFHPMPIYRPYRSLAEKTDYETFTAQPEVAPYVLQQADEESLSPYIENSFGGLTVGQGGWVSIPEVVKSIALHFLEKEQFVVSEIKYNELTVSDKSVCWQDVTFKKVLFCDGPHARENPFFSWLPYNVVKGQILTARVAHYPIRQLVNQGAFILPINDTTIRIGATYSWHDLDWQTSADGRAFLETKVRGLLKIPYEMIGQSAGIRPATKDRRPFIGLHPHYPAVGIFGGFGSKGVSLTPYLARQFARFLIHREDLDPEVNIQRCLSLL